MRVILIIILLLTAACTKPQPDISASPTRLVVGNAVKGPISNATINLYQLDANGSPVLPAIETTTTNANGEWSISTTLNALLLIEVAGGTYLDESDTETDLNKKRKITLGATDVMYGLLQANATTATVNILTHAMYLRLAPEIPRVGTLDNTFTRLTNRISSAVGFDIFSTVPTNPAQPASAASSAQREYAMLLGGLANMVNARAVNAGLTAPNYATILATVNELAACTMTAGVTPVEYVLENEFNREVRRFRNNNDRLYRGETAPVVDFNLLCQTTPVANADNISVDEDTAFDISVLLSNDTDTNGDTIVFHSNTAGSSAQGGSIALSSDQTTWEYKSSPDYNGTDSFSYVIDDGFGNTASGTVIVTVVPVNDLPVANADAFTIDEDQALANIDLTSNDSDVDGDTLTVSSIDVSGTTGSAVLNGDGTVTYSPQAHFFGADTFSYTVTDGNGEFASASVTININSVNDAPVAVNDSATVYQNMIWYRLDALANDTDIEGDALSVDAITGVSTGSASINADNTIKYIPPADYLGPVTITYRVNDGTDTSLTDGTILLSVDANVDTDGDTFLDGHELQVNADINSTASKPAGTVVNFADSTIAANTTWTLLDSPLQINNTVTVQSGATLTIDPGVIVRFNPGTGIVITNGGDLTINGISSTLPGDVQFTSYFDQVNQKTATNNPNAGDWSGVTQQAGSTATTNFTTIKYAATGLSLNGVSSNWSNLSVANSQNNGVYVNAGAPTLQTVTISDAANGLAIYNGATGTYNSFTINSANVGVYVDASNPGLNGFNINGGQTGLALNNAATGSYASVTVDGPSAAAMSIADNSDAAASASITLQNTNTPYALSTQTTLPSNLGYTLGTGATADFVVLAGALSATTHAISTSTPLGGSSKWLIPQTLSIPNGATLSVAANVTLNLLGAATYIDVDNGGALNLNGTSGNVVTLTSTVPTAGSWGGIRYFGGSTGALTFATLQYPATGVYLENTAPTMSDLIIQNASADAVSVYASSSAVNITGNTITANSIGGSGLRLREEGADITVQNITINADSGTGVTVEGANSNVALTSVNILGSCDYSFAMTNGANASVDNASIFDGATTAAVYLSGNSGGSSSFNATLNLAPLPYVIDGQTWPNINTASFGASLVSKNIELRGSFSGILNLSAEPLGTGTNWVINTAFALSGSMLLDPAAFVFINNAGSLTLDANSYLQMGDGAQIEVEDGTVTFSEGVVVKSGASVYFDVGPFTGPAVLNINGVEGNPVVFTSIKDDSVAGDSNGDTNTTIPAVADWGGFSCNLATCTIQHGMFRYGSQAISGKDITISKSVFYRNRSAISANSATGTVSIVDSVFTENHATTLGPVSVSDTSASSSIQNNIFRSNISDALGGALNITAGTSMSVVNNLFTENTAATGGGAIYVGGTSTAIFQHNTIAGNNTTTTDGGGGLFSDTSATPVIKDNIIWNNDDGSGSTASDNTKLLGTVTEDYNLSNNPALAGANSVTGDPLFVNGWYLSSTVAGQGADSPALNAGSLGSLPTYLTDLVTPTTVTNGIVDGSGQLPDNTVIDMGFHFKGSPHPPVDAAQSTVTVDYPSISVSTKTFVRVTPKDSVGNRLGPLQDVSAAVHASDGTLNGTIVAVRDMGTGVYEIEFQASAAASESDTLELTVNGTVLSTTATISW